MKPSEGKKQVDEAALTDGLLARARAGDEEAFRELTDPYLPELQLYCYRIVGSLQDAEDLRQETLLAAWRGLARFEGRTSLRAWLYRIATNQCLNALRQRKRRPREVQPMDRPPEPTRRGEPVWPDPYPDALLEGLEATSAGPEARYEMREAVGLAFVTALHHLPSRQRAVLVLRDVLGFRAGEVAEMLDSSIASVKAALQRARAAVKGLGPARDHRPASPPRSGREQELVASFADAVERGDTEGIVALLTDDARLMVRPHAFEYQGRKAIGGFIDDRARLLRGPLRLVPTRANGQPAFGCYAPDAQPAAARAIGLMVLTVARAEISAITWYSDPALLSHFGLPRMLRDLAPG